MKFTDLYLIGPLQKALAKNNFENTTEIQEKIIPEIILGKDVIGLAKTGSGKTFSFLLPFLNNLYLFKKENGTLELKDRNISFLIIAPTRELAIQIGENLKLFSNNVNLKYDVIFGGVNQFHQEKSINKGLDVLVATPGRLVDLMKQGIVDLKNIKYFVLDEADKMLDMGFISDIEYIISKMGNNFQTALFSATMPDRIEKLSNNILKNPTKIEVSKSGQVEEKINQNVILLEEKDKFKALKYLIEEFKNQKIIIFVNTKDDCDIVFGKIKLMGFNADYIHRNRSQNARQRAIKGIKSGDINIIVATDIASRGIDIDGLDLVINFSLPKEAEVYVHRSGRTARAGNTGTCFSLVTKLDEFKLEIIENLIGEKINVFRDETYKNLGVPSGEYMGSFGVNENKKYKKKRYYKK